MTTHTIPGLAELKERSRATRAAGGFPEVARLTLREVGERLVRRIGVGREEDVLDLACDTGNAAIRVAQAGGRTTGVDLTPELFEAGRALAKDVGVDVEWVEGDAEALSLDVDHVRTLFDGTGIVLELAIESLPLTPFPSAEGAVDWNEKNFGPMIMLHAYLELQGRWQACRERLLEFDDPAALAEYLVVSGRKL